MENYITFHLEAIHTQEGKGGSSQGGNLLDWYGNVLHDRKSTLASLSSYIIANANFAKNSFVDKILSMEMEMYLIS